ncbi:MAG: hypothetical protein ABJE95_26245 [Byssovorax sp.]
MKRRLLIALLALGTVGGYGSAFAGMRCHAHARRAAMERHVAHVCVEAARNPAGDAPSSQEDRWDW